MFEKIDPLDTVPARDLAKIRRRASVRYRCHLASPAHLATADTEQPVLAWIHNLSATGVGLLLEQPLEAATPLELELFTAGGARVTAHGRAVHATRRADGTWLVGCELYQPLTPDEMDALL